MKPDIANVFNLIPDKKTRMKTGKAGLIDDPKRSQKYKEFLKNVERPDEAPEVVDAPVPTVKSRMRYALERLQSALSEYEEYARMLK